MVIRGTMGHFTHAKAGRRISASRFPHVRVFLSVPPGEYEQQDRTVSSRSSCDARRSRTYAMPLLSAVAESPRICI